jgi:hypothetical protein
MKISFGYLLMFFIIIIMLFSCFCYKEGFSTNASFSNTQKWGIFEKNILNKKSEVIDKLYKNAPRKKYPSNNSSTTKHEISDIKEKIKDVSIKQRINIINELDFDNIIRKFKTSNKLRKSLEDSINEIADPIIMKLKDEYDRVRPSYLDRKIKPIIDVPKHPSYPSGHSTQSFYIAYQLSKMRPDKHNEYMEIANSIAENREYAGVHYKSDSDYGKILGKYLSDNISIVHF